MFDKASVSRDELLKKLVDAKRDYPKLGVVVRGDGKTDFEHVADVMATCRQANISDLNMAVQQRQKSLKR